VVAAPEHGLLIEKNRIAETISASSGVYSTEPPFDPFSIAGSNGRWNRMNLNLAVACVMSSTSLYKVVILSEAESLS
jgi:hypothetical protein